MTRIERQVYNWVRPLVPYRIHTANCYHTVIHLAFYEQNKANLYLLRSSTQGIECINSDSETVQILLHNFPLSDLLKTEKHHVFHLVYGKKLYMYNL